MSRFALAIEIAAAWAKRWREDVSNDAESIAAYGSYPEDETPHSIRPATRHRIWWSASQGMWAGRLRNARPEEPTVFSRDQIKLADYLDRLERFQKANPTVK